MSEVRGLKILLADHHPDDEHICWQLWTVEDVISWCRLKHIPMTHDVAVKVIDRMAAKASSLFGVTWDTLAYAVDYVKEKPTFWKFYQCDCDGLMTDNPELTLYFMTDPGYTESHAWTIAWHFLGLKGVDVPITPDLENGKEDDEGFFYTIEPLDEHDGFFENAPGDIEDPIDLYQDRQYDLLTNPVVLAVDGKGIPLYTVPRCPYCHEELYEIDNVYTVIKRWIWDHEKMVLEAPKEVGEPGDNGYECSHCDANISTYFWQFKVEWQ